jgi:predicted DNA-binding protein with PD1-like motif
MKYKKFNNKVLFRVDKGEEIVESIKKICSEFDIKLGTVSGLGAANKIVLGLFETETKKYLSQEYVGDYELCPVYGNITTQDGKIYLHCHVNIAGVDHKSFAGHLSSAIVSATFEGIIDIWEGEVDRKFDDKIGLNLLKL